MTLTLAPSSDLSLLNELAGRFENGYTEEDIISAHRALAHASGLHMVCLWAYSDRWGAGGASEEYLIDASGVWYELPPLLWALLCDGSNIDDLDALAHELTAAREVSFPSLTQLDEANYAAVDYGDAEAP